MALARRMDVVAEILEGLDWLGWEPYQVGRWAGG